MSELRQLRSLCDIDWDGLLEDYYFDSELLSLKLSVELMSIPRYVELIPILIDACPKPQLIRCLARSYYTLKSASRYFEKSIPYFYRLIDVVNSCFDHEKKGIFQREIIRIWSLIDLFESLFNTDWAFDSQFRNEYCDLLEKLIIMIPDETKEYLMSGSGQEFCWTLKHVHSCGFGYDVNQLIDKIDHLMVRLELIPVEYTPPMGMCWQLESCRM